MKVLLFDHKSGGRLRESGAAGDSHHRQFPPGAASRSVFRLTLFGLLSILVAGTALAQGRLDGANTPYDDAKRAAAVDSISTALREVYIFAEVAEEMADLMRENLENGEYADLIDAASFSARLTDDLRSVSHDLHLRVFPIDPPQNMAAEAAPDTDPEARIEEQRARLARNNFGFKRLEILSGNIGYLKLDGFNNTYFGGDTAIGAMNFFANCEALIIDLRANGGGSPTMIQLLTSYFFDDPTHLNSFYIRRTDETQQFWTTQAVVGPSLVDTDLFILTSGGTFSAAEEFTYNLKNLERATVVGETTGGGAHPVEGHVFAYVNLGMSLPFGRAINPITGTNWEGTGVSPHIEVPAPDALGTAHLEALKKVRARATEPQDLAAIDFGVAELEAQLHPFLVGDAKFASYVGQYEDRTISGDEEGVYYSRGGRTPMRMIPLTDRLFRFEEIDYFHLEVELDAAGNPVSLIGRYADGRKDQSRRTSS